ncbi:APC family permease [Mesoplasma seiffertii]|uniref:APC family permease n=1 Tax=Mesoplasma seiffertii TaxID=28224 RepID=UPI000687B1C0|nr:APC family permease [Mesoplasma seiffertii]
MIKNKAKLFELLTLFTMVIGTVVGTGIYVKNNELLVETGNPIIAIILWFVVGMVCVGIVYVFIEISSATRKFGNGTIGNWTKLFVGRKAASLCSMMYLIIYVPSCQGIFTVLFVTYIFKIFNVVLPPGAMFSLYLFIGISMIVIFLFINMYSPFNASKKILLFGTFFKFIPLIIALFAGFILAGTNGAMSNGGFGDQSWSTSDFDPGLFIRGFGGILFSFDGFIYIANAQKTAKHKEVVPKALLFGMIFVAIFYVLMAISLFLGSPDGTIENVLVQVFGGKGAGTLITNLVSIVICFMGINIFSYIGVVGMQSDAQSRVVYSKGRNIDYIKAGYIQMVASIIIFTLFLTLGFGLSSGDWQGFGTSTNIVNADGDNIYQGLVFGNAAKYVGIMSSTAACFGFSFITVLIFASIKNRMTNKVEVEKIKGFLPVAWVSGILLALFVILGIYTFLVPIDVYKGVKVDDIYVKTKWIESSGFIFLLLLIAGISAIAVLYFIQEYKFKKDPFVNGFEGEIQPEEVIAKRKASEIIKTSVNKVLKR